MTQIIDDNVADHYVACITNKGAYCSCGKYLDNRISAEDHMKLMNKLDDSMKNDNKKIKSTYELSGSTRDLIEEISSFFGLTKVEVIELAINKPKIFMTAADIYEKRDKKV